MSWIKRIYEFSSSSIFQKGKVSVLYGARRAGKTTLIQHLMSDKSKNCFIGNGDDIQVREILSSENQSIINAAFKGYDIVFIDEAQRIPKIGWGLKILIDSNPEMTIIASGSSSFELANAIGEPLTGRQKVSTLFPISMLELAENYGRMHVVQNLQTYLIYGCYPECITSENKQQKQEYLLELRNSYLFKDILELDSIKNAQKLVDLLRLIAFQIGHEISYNELANSLGIAKQTVERYLDLLEKAFIVFKVRGYSGNLRKEVSKSPRYYFWDNGIRNALIQNFNEPAIRMDMGMLWENFCMVERLKKQHYLKIMVNNYFWRTYDQQEIDLIEETAGKLQAFEFKYSPNKSPKAPKAFRETYTDASFECIHPGNFLEFVL